MKDKDVQKPSGRSSVELNDIRSNSQEQCIFQVQKWNDLNAMSKAKDSFRSTHFV